MKPFVAALGLVSLVVVSALPAQDRPAGDGVVELPKFIVTDNRELPQPESWQYAQIDGFEILSNASVKATQRLIRDFTQFRQALSYVWPLPNRVTERTALIICGRGNQFDRFVPAGTASPDVAMASLFLKQGTKTAIVIDLQATTLNVLNVDDSADAATGTDSGLISVEHDKQLYREYVRYLLSRTEPRQPAWLEEGLAQIIMRMQFDRRWIQYAKLEDPNTISTQAAMVMDANAALGADGDGLQLAGAPAEDRDFNSALRRRALVPLGTFFNIKHDSPEARNVLGNNRWAKQAYAFVHMCLYGQRGKYQKAFTTFLLRAAKEPVTEPMFKECFGMSYKDMLMEIRGYCDFTVYEAKEFRSTKGGPDLIDNPPPLALREATQSEIGRIKGETMLLAGRKPAARIELFAPYARGERDPELLASLGLYEKSAGEDDRARKFLEAAYAGKAKRSDAMLELARYRYADALAKPAGGEGRFSAAQVAAVMDPLQVGRRSPPHNYAIYDLAADTLARSAVKLKRDDALVLIDGAQLFPARLKMVYQAAAISAEVGELQAAHALADHGIKYAPDVASKKRFEELKASLPPAPATTEVTPAAAATKPASDAKAAPAPKK